MNFRSERQSSHIRPCSQTTPAEAGLTVRKNNRGSRNATPSYRFQPFINLTLRKAMFSAGSAWLESDSDTNLDQAGILLTMAYRPIQLGAINRITVVEIQ
jgi:hypothetical protein